MGDDDAVRRLVDILASFFTLKRPVEEDLRYSITSEFLRNIQDLLFTKQMALKLENGHSYLDFINRSLLSPEMYLRYVIYACRQIALVTPNMLERFLSVFAFMLVVGARPNCPNYCKLVPDLFMVVYEHEFKKAFCRCGGFRRLVKYVNNPNYLDSVCVVRNIFELYLPEITFDGIPECLKKAERDKRMCKHVALPNFDFKEAATDETSLLLAKKVLEVSQVKFLPSPREGPPSAGEDSISRCSDFFRQQITELQTVTKSFNRLEETLKHMVTSTQAKSPTSLNEDPPLPSDKSSNSSLTDLLQGKTPTLKKVGNFKEIFESSGIPTQVPLPSLLSDVLPSPSLNLNLSHLSLQERAELKMENIREKIGDSNEILSSPALNSKSDDDIGQMNSGSWYEKIIESVIKHNHSKSHTRSQGRIQMEADGILEHLNGTIQSLLQVLDDSDQK